MPCNRSSRCFSTRAARSAIVMFAPFDLPDEPEKRSLNASPPELAAFLIAVLPAFDDVLIPEAVLGGC